MEADERERLGYAVWVATVAYAAVAEPGVTRVPWDQLDETAREAARVAGEAAVSASESAWHGRAEAAEAKLAEIGAQCHGMLENAAAAGVPPSRTHLSVERILAIISGEDGDGR